MLPEFSSSNFQALLHATYNLKHIRHNQNSLQFPFCFGFETCGVMYHIFLTYYGSYQTNAHEIVEPCG